MTTSSRLLIVPLITALLALPSLVDAKVGYQGESDPEVQDAAPTPSEIQETELSTGALLELQKAEEARLLWEKRINDTKGFWAGYMNNRKASKAFRDQHILRRDKRKEKRLQCRNDVRRANRDTILSETMHCFRATLTLDLEILRKKQQHVETMVGVAEGPRNSAVFYIQNLMEAISTIVEAIDAGVYGSKEDLEEAKVNLESHYRAATRTAIVKLRVSRSQTWLTHLMVRLHNVLMSGDIQEEVVPSINESIACLEQKKELLETLYELEEYSALIDGFRQVQSEVKFCTEMAVDAHRLNKELEQADAENTEE